MNNNILDDYCSFEVSKLLKKKGFDIGGVPIVNSLATTHNESQGYLSNYLHKEHIFRRPSHALAIKWIRENFGIHIFVTPYTIRNKVLYESHIYKQAYSYSGVSYEKATEAALLYALK